MPHPSSVILLALLSLWVVGCPAWATPLPDAVPDFIDFYCADCHDDVEAEADLDLWSLSEEPVDMDNLATWIKAYDRASNGEMPPKEKRRPDPDDLKAFRKGLAEAIIATETAELATTGRALKRRMNRYEYENAIRDLLQLPYLEIKDSLPEDPTAFGYNKVGEALDVSHVQVARYLKTAEYALREAIAPGPVQPKLIDQRYYTWQQKQFNRPVGPDLRKSWPIVELDLQEHLLSRRIRDLEWEKPDWAQASRSWRAEKEAVVMLMSTYEPAEIKFEQFRAPATGRYRLRFAGYTVWMAPDFSKVTRGRRNEPITIYSETPPRRLRRHGTIDFYPDSTISELTVWLKKGESIQPDAARLVRSRPPDFKNPFLEEDGMPGAAFQWMDVTGPLVDEWPGPGHQLLFGALPLIEDPENPGKWIIHSENPTADAKRLLEAFMAQAYRKPVSQEAFDPFYALILSSLDKGYGFMDSMIAGYTAVLASPAFLYLDPAPGPLTPYALADRLSFFLWNSPPDEALRQLAQSGEILQPETLDQEVNRLLNDPKAQRFVDSFLDYWLDLRFMNASGPDAELYPEYQLDDHLVESLPEETRLFFKDLVDRDMGVTHIVDTDYVLINERLATLYAIEGVAGAHFRPVLLHRDSPRGGLMTQASVLKVTANGTTSSPIERGAWIMERILGYHPPPPPPSVQAIESDIRGAKTIREQLALHRSQPSCNACHVYIDPPGFALESFDVMGAWRDRYRTTSKGAGEPVPGVGHDGLRFKFKIGLPVDASGEMPDGRAFDDIRDLKAHLVQNPALLAKNLVEQLSIYATGAPVRFSDRATIQEIVESARASDYGVRTLIAELVKSDLFLYK